MSMAACGSPPPTPSRKKNIGKAVSDALVEQRMSLKTFKDRGMPVEWGTILGAFGCNYEGELSTELILHRVQQALDEAELAGFKLKGIKLTDAMGWATPASVYRLIGAIRNKWPELEISLHLHDTRGTGMAAAYAGLQLGVTKFDASIAGLGGCPFAATDGAAGNICTEDFAFMCEEMGVETGLDIDSLIEAAKVAEDVVGRLLPGHVMRGGTLKAAKLKAAQKARMNAETMPREAPRARSQLDLCRGRQGAVGQDALSRHRGQDPDGEQGDRPGDPADALGARRAPAAARACRGRADLRDLRLLLRSHGHLPCRRLCLAPRRQPPRCLDRRGLPGAGGSS